jgi:ankyrin repeat protein
MNSNNFIDTTCDDYFLNPYKFIDCDNKTCNHNNKNCNQNNNFFLSNINTEKNLNLIIKTLTSIIMSNNDFNKDESKYQNNENNINNKFVIFKLIANNNLEELKKILNNDNKNINIQDKDGDTALHIAIFLSNYKASNILIRNGANFLIKDKWGQIPLHRICFNLKNKNTIKIINLMSKSNSKNNTENNIFNNLDLYNNTPLHLVLKYIIKNNMFVGKNILSIINKLTELTDINLINNDGLSVRDLIKMLNLEE